MMAYNDDDLIKIAVEKIESENLTTISEVISFLPCQRSTFYEHHLDKSDAIKKGLFENRTNMKRKLKNKWLDGNNSTAQIALFRLLADEDELDRLNTNNIKTTGDEGLTLTVKHKIIGE